MTGKLSRREAITILAGAALGCGAGPSRSAGASNAHRPMLTRTIASTREQIPVIGLGTWQTFDVGGSDSASQDFVLG